MGYNEKSYYDRMSNTMNDKCNTLFPYLYEGSKVLDFGAGKNLSVSNLVKAFNGTYVAVDNSIQSQQFFEENGIVCYDSVEDFEDKFDIIFMSSVYHELLSYLNPLEVAKLARKLSSLLSDNGKIVIRDWNMLDASKWQKQDSIIIEPSKSEEINKWISALQERGIIEHNDRLRINKVSIEGSRNDLYNILYHTTWGLASILRESKENYAIPAESLFRYFYNSGLEIDSKEIKWDDEYIKFMSPYFTSYEDRVLNREEWLSPKVVLTMKKVTK